MRDYQFKYEPYHATYGFNFFDMYTLDAIWKLFKLWISFGNKELYMNWEERDGSNPRQGLLPIEKIQVLNYCGTKFIEIS